MDKIRKGSVKITLKDRLFNFGYGIGASVVIIGVLFKLMYWEAADIMLTVGLITEAFIFAMSAFEKPLKTYEWDKLFDFEHGQIDLRSNGEYKVHTMHTQEDIHATDAARYGAGDPYQPLVTHGIPSRAPSETSPFSASPTASPVSAIPVGGVAHSALPSFASLNRQVRL